MSKDNVMSIAQVTNKVTREAFDISRRVCFTAKIGELLPIRCIEMEPNDVVKYSPNWFTRTQPVNTAAYTRIQEYYDFFFVPTNLLWSFFNTFVVQMGDNAQIASSINSNTVIGQRHPYFSSEKIFSFLQRTVNNDGSLSDPTNETVLPDVSGLSRFAQSCKLLHYLGYGNPLDFYFQSAGDKLNFSPFPLLAYQKIYSDWYRDQMWELANPSTFNIDYCRDELPLADLDPKKDTMFTLRYANFKKDMFMGVTPQSQYGDAAIVKSAGNDSTFLVQGWDMTTSQNVSIPSDTALKTKVYQDKLNFIKAQNDNIVLQLSSKSNLAQFSVLALRKAEASQKWKEITQANQKDYKHQIKAHFDTAVSDAYSQHVMWLDGSSSTLDIGEVVNTNLNSGEDNNNTSVASLAGKGVGSGGDSEKSFTAPCHGIFMCIYHAAPLMDYTAVGYEPLNLKTLATDYAVPEYDRTGNVPVPIVQMLGFNIKDWVSYKPDMPLGYAPQYYDYKTTFDIVLGGFVFGGLDAWVAPLTREFFLERFKASGYKMDYTFFKINPQQLDSIFAVNAVPSYPTSQFGYDKLFGMTLATDQLLVNFFLQCTVVRSLDRNGLPY